MMENKFTKISDIKRLAFITNALQDKLSKGDHVLDVGCGNGIISRHIAKCGFKVLGIDVSEKTIDRARSLNPHPNVEYKVMSAENVSLGNMKFKAAVCSEVLEHLHKPESLLLDIYNSLADDGILIVTVPNGAGPRETFVTRPVQRMQQKNSLLWKGLNKFKQALGYTGYTVQSAADDLTHVQFFSKNDLQNLACQSSYHITKFGKTNFVDDVFPVSFFARRMKFIQQLDSKIADLLPSTCTGGFVTVWQKKLPA